MEFSLGNVLSNRTLSILAQEHEVTSRDLLRHRSYDRVVYAFKSLIIHMPHFILNP